MSRCLFPGGKTRPCAIDYDRDTSVKRSVKKWSVILPYGSLVTVDLRYKNVHSRGGYDVFVLRNTEFHRRLSIENDTKTTVYYSVLGRVTNQPGASKVFYWFSRICSHFHDQEADFTVTLDMHGRIQRMDFIGFVM